jgi:hypothetical protein
LDYLPFSSSLLSKDASLAELTELIREKCTDARTRLKGRAPSLHFSLVYPDRNGKYAMKDLGTVHDGARDVVDGSDGGGEHLKTLAEVGFQAGDFLDVAVLVPPR